MTTARRPRLHARRTYSARAVPCTDGRWLLELRRGAWRKTVDKLGDEVSCMREQNATLFANIGDWLILSSTDVDDFDGVGSVEVVAVDGRGQPTVRLVRGEMPSSGGVLVMQGKKAKAGSKRKAA